MCAWTTDEENQIRHRLGIDGTAVAPSATPSLALQATLTDGTYGLAALNTDLDTLLTRVTAAAALETTAQAIKAKTDLIGTGSTADTTTILTKIAELRALVAEFYR